MKLYNPWIVSLTIIMVLVAVAANTSLVSADGCVAQLSAPSTMIQYSYDSKIMVQVPVSLSCPFIGDQVYAVGNAIDTFPFQNVDRGSANTRLSFTYGSNVYVGNLQFNLSPVVQGHTLMISVRIYGD